MNLLYLTESTQFEHSRMVAKISRLLAERAGYPPHEAEAVEQAALLHDVGKCGVPA